VSKKIVIVGGGSAGWMTATTFIRCFPDWDISLIESPNIPISGVGESTLQSINTWLRLVGIEDKDFMRCTGSFQVGVYRDAEGYSNNWFDEEADNGKIHYYDIEIPEKDGDLYFSVETYY